MDDAKRFSKLPFGKLRVYFLAFGIGLVNISCKNWTRLPSARYDLLEEWKKESQYVKPTDTLVFWTYGSGYLRGSEHNNYYAVKLRNKTLIKRTSNFQKFDIIEIPSSSFPWQFIITNFDKITDEEIQNEPQLASHGPSTNLKVKLGQKEHKVWLGPLVRYNNEGTMNFTLIQKLEEIGLNLSFKPSEKKSFKWERN